MTNKKRKQDISVETFFRETRDQLNLKLVTGQDSFQKKIVEREVHRPGLALAGFVDLFTYHRVQICGNTEASYLGNLSEERLEQSLRKVFEFDIPCFVDTSDNGLPSSFMKLAHAYGISVFRSSFPTTKLTQMLSDYLDAKFAPLIHLHGTLVDVYGIGMLITGRSGIGKSEVALDLVSRGHRLVSDDVVSIKRRTGGVLIGSVNETLQYHMEIRGLGIIDIQAMFGIRGIRKQKRVEVQVELVDWDKTQKYERLGLKEITTDILGEKIPLVRLPIYPGKNISMIIEVIALNELLKIFGYHAAREFVNRLRSE